jgi:hypothetical protein
MVVCQRFQWRWTTLAAPLFAVGAPKAANPLLFPDPSHNFRYGQPEVYIVTIKIQSGQGDCSLGVAI